MSLRGRTEKVAPALGTMQVLVVACGNTYLAIPGAIVRGIVESAEAVQARIISLFGDTCRVTDLAARLGLTPSGVTQDARIILCGEQRARQAWRVDRALGLTNVDLQRITPLPAHFAGVEQNWFTGLFLFRDMAALLLNPGWLLSQSMDAFIAQPLAGEGAVLEEPRALDQAPAVVEAGAAAATASAEGEQPVAAQEKPRPSVGKKRGRLKRPAPAVGDDASFDVLENLVLEESTDAEDDQTPWADA